MNNYRGSAWPQDKIDRLIALHQTGYSAGRTAEELGISRNAAIGKAWRLGLSFERQPREHKTRITTTPLTASQLLALAKGRQKGIDQAMREHTERKLTNQISTKIGTTIEGLCWSDGIPVNCRAILHGEGIDTIYCGKPVYMRSYCAHHFRKFYHTTREEQRAADRAAQGRL